MVVSMENRGGERINDKIIKVEKTPFGNKVETHLITNNDGTHLVEERHLLMDDIERLDFCHKQDAIRGFKKAIIVSFVAILFFLVIVFLYSNMGFVF